MADYNKINSIKLNSTMLSKQLFAGNFLSIFNGQGINFKELREYSIGDDFRSIDWTTTARMNKPFVKINEDERQQHIIFMVDVSKSIEFANSQNSYFKKNKKDIISELCFLLAQSSISNKDKIGAIFFSEIIEKVVPLSNSANTISQIASNLIDYEPTRGGTNFNLALNYLNATIKKNTIVIVFSDFFIEPNFEKELAIATNKFKLIIIQINNKNETNQLNFGIIKTLNKETEKIEYLKINQKTVSLAIQKQQQIHLLIEKYKVPFINIALEDNYLVNLKYFFDNIKKRNEK
jgi:uncharacterized protein (DUF58 family)